MDLKLLFVLAFTRFSSSWIVMKNGSIQHKYSVTNSLQYQLFNELLKTQNNVSMVISPLGVRLPLCKLATIAAGEARVEVMSVLGYEYKHQLNNCFNNYAEVLNPAMETSLMLISKLYVHYRYQVDKDFANRDTSMKQFRVLVDKVGFDLPTAARAFMNRWVEKVSLGRIRDLLDENDINQNSSIVIVSATHYQVGWIVDFDVRLTKVEKFYASNSEIHDVPMMAQLTSHEWGDGVIPKAKIIAMELDYLMTLTCLLPDHKDGMPALISFLSKNPRSLTTAKHAMTRRLVLVKIPRIKLKFSVDFNDILKKIGLRKVFDVASSGLGGMVNNETNVSLSKVKQRNYIDIDEYGVHRSPPGPDQPHIHSDELLHNPHPLSSKYPYAEMILDRPFLFSIDVRVKDPSTSRTRLDKGFIHELYSGIYRGPQDTAQRN